MSYTLYPTQLDSWPDPSANTGLATAGYEHDIAHSRLNDSVEALEAKAGVNSSPVSSTLDYVQKHHQHSGTDGSATLANLTARAVTDGQVLNVMNSGGTTLISGSTASAGPTFQITAGGLATVAQVVQQASGGTATADLVNWRNNAGAVLGGVQAGGTIYTGGALVLQKGQGGAQYLTAQPSAGEIDLINGGIFRGYSGAYTGANGAGEQFHLDAASGFLKLGGTSGNPSLILNAWNSTRMGWLQLTGKDNADAGLTTFNLLADADGQAFTARSFVIQGNLGKTTGGTYIGVDTFMALAYPTYDGNVTYTKAVGFSVTPNTAPTLTAGTVSIAGAFSTSGNATIGGSLSVTGALTATSATTNLSALTTTGNVSVGGTLGVTGATTVAGLTATTLTVTGSSTFAAISATTGTFSGALTAQSLQANLTGTAGRFIGRTNGSPTGGPYNAGDYAIDPTNAALWICSAAGSPGTWVQAGSPAYGPTDSGWTLVFSNPPFTNGWTNYGSGTQSVSFRKVNGFVYLRGHMSSGTVNAAAFTLPANHVPSGTKNFVVSSNGAYGNVSITSGGVVTLTAGSNLWVSLDGIFFDATS